MGTRDARVDAYIAKSAEFARPILTALRIVVHRACPQVEETLKWGMPFFQYRGLLCHMAAFKQHCAFGFWKGARVLGAAAGRREAMGHFGRLTAVRDLPPRQRLATLIRKAMALNAAGVWRPARGLAHRRARPTPPPDLLTELRKKPKALAHYRAFTPAQQREYVDWLREAKRADTRARRLAQALAWIAAGRTRNWKYAT